MNHETYKNKLTRDLRAKELKAQGYIVKRRSTGPAQLHPEYINDWDQPYETGFGNTDYMTYHKNLFVIEFGKEIV